MGRVVEMRFHGRGGQGALTAAELVAISAINEGRYAQAFPAFGPERRGAPVLAFARISDEHIHLRCQIYEPDVVVILDSTLLEIVDIAEGLKESGTIVINTTKRPDQVGRGLGVKATIATVNATRIALEELKRPITNTAILGALIKATQLVKLDSLVEAIKDGFKGKIAEMNVNAVKRAYEETNIGKC